MKDRKQVVDDIMQSIDPHWRYRWCEAKACGCMGAVNCSARTSSHKTFEGGWVTKQEWQTWVAENPKDPREERNQELRAKMFWDAYCK